MGYPNQKRIIIKKEPCDDKEHLYAKINIAALQKAMTELKTTGAIKLWLYLAKNQDNYTFDLSCADCCKYGIKTDAYHAAVKNLITTGYLKHYKGNIYVFNEIGTSMENP